MNKSILISIKPKFVAKILNGEKKIEIRKTAPKCDLPIEVYIYCTKGEDVLWTSVLTNNSYLNLHEDYVFPGVKKRNGRVVAKFTLKKAEEFIQGLNEAEYEHLPNFALKDYEYYGLEDLMGKACLNDEEIAEYAPDLSFYAWRIDDLVIFDEPKELSEFFNGFKLKNNGTVLFDYDNEALRQRTLWGYEYSYPLKKAPKSWCYVEVRE